MKIIDLSHALTENMPIYPGTTPPHFHHELTLEEHGFRETRLDLLSHTGTHIDAPGHILPQGRYLDDFPAAQFFGLALIIDFPHCAGQRIERFQLEQMEHKIARAEFVLFHTRHYQKWGQPAYLQDYTLLSAEAAEWLGQFPLKGIGVDMISVDELDTKTYPIHNILLRSNDRVIIENLCNLQQVAGEYCLFCAQPLPYAQADGSPVRAIAIEMETQIPAAAQ